MELFEINNEAKLNLICVGVGNSGCNIIKYMSNKPLVGVDLIAMK